MSFQAYLENIKAKTGKTPEDFAKLATQKGLSKHGEVIAWLKADFGLGHGHANAIAATLLKSGKRKESPDQKLDALLSGKKGAWRTACENIISQAKGLGFDVTVSIGETYVSLLRAAKKFAILQPSSAERLDIGIKLKGVPPEGRLEAAGSWNAMVTHRVRIAADKEIDAQLFGWLKTAYLAAYATGAASRTHDAA